MRVLFSTIGSRGDVQPLVALALHMKTLGHEVRACVPPDFREWMDSLGVPVTTIGPEVRKFAASKPIGTQRHNPPTAEQRRQMVEGTVAAQFDTITPAAKGCDIIVAATALQVAARSVAEMLGIHYVIVAYSPVVLPSLQHSPPPLPGQAPPMTNDNRQLWALDAERFNDAFGRALNARRELLGLPPVGDVRSHMMTDRPWVAADPTLGPWPESSGDGVFQTGAWLLPDKRPLSSELAEFLANGEPPIYFGLGSTAASREMGQVMIESARAMGRRAIVSQGWYDTPFVDNEADCLSIGEVNLNALFSRVAAVVHHGGAGTTTAAALAGAPQVVIPTMYDQYYWAQQVRTLGVGTDHASGAPTTESLSNALERTLRAEVTARARSIATAVHRDGTEIAAETLIAQRTRA